LNVGAQSLPHRRILEVTSCRHQTQKLRLWSLDAGIDYAARISKTVEVLHYLIFIDMGKAQYGNATVLRDYCAPCGPGGIGAGSQITLCV